MDASGKPLELQTVALATRGNAFLNSRAIWQNGTFHFFVSHAVHQLRVDGIWLAGGAVRLIDARSADVIESGALVLEELPEPEPNASTSPAEAHRDIKALFNSFYTTPRLPQ